MAIALRPPFPPPNPLADVPKTLRRLFLDDDPARAEIFLSKHPDAIWVQTVPECIERLAECWDEIHLDHDLGGEVYVDSDREDCGMEVVRWLAREPRTHLNPARFVVHSHNINASILMAFQIQALGFRVEARPFGLAPPPSGAGPNGRWARARALLRRLRGLPPPTPPLPEQDQDSPDWVP